MVVVFHEYNIGEDLINQILQQWVRVGIKLHVFGQLLDLVVRDLRLAVRINLVHGLKRVDVDDGSSNAFVDVQYFLGCFELVHNDGEELRLGRQVNALQHRLISALNMVQKEPMIALDSAFPANFIDPVNSREHGFELF